MASDFHEPQPEAQAFLSIVRKGVYILGQPEVPAFVPAARKGVYISVPLVAMRNLQPLVLNLSPSSGSGQPPYSRVAVLGDSKSKFRNPWVRVK